MGRTAADIQAEIAEVRAAMSAGSVANEVSDSGRTIRTQDFGKLQKRLDSLYIMLGRADGSAPMAVRTRVMGQGMPPSCGTGYPVAIQ